MSTVDRMTLMAYTIVLIAFSLSAWWAPESSTILKFRGEIVVAICVGGLIHSLIARLNPAESAGDSRDKLNDI